MAEEKQLIKKTKKRHLDIGLVVVTLILLALGVIMVLSASAPSAFRLEGDSYFYFKKQAMFAVIGIVVMLVVSRVDYKVYSSKILANTFLGIALALLIAVLIPGVGITRNDATRWINIGIQFQPSEIMKIALIIFMAEKISKNPKKLEKFWSGLVPYLCLIGVIAVLLLLEPHMSATVIMVMVAGSILLVGRSKNGTYITFYTYSWYSWICTFFDFRI